MITKEQIKAIIKIINKKNFTPSFTRFHYRKEKNHFVATDSFILMTIKNNFGGFDFDFSINIDDLKKIKDNVLGINIEGEVATIITKSEDIKIVIHKNESFPDDGVENITNQKQENKSIILNSIHYARFFEISTLLKHTNIFIHETTFFTKEENTTIICRIPTV